MRSQVPSSFRLKMSTLTKTLSVDEGGLVDNRGSGIERLFGLSERTLYLVGRWINEDATGELLSGQLPNLMAGLEDTLGPWSWFGCEFPMVDFEVEPLSALKTGNEP